MPFERGPFSVSRPGSPTYFATVVWPCAMIMLRTP